MYYILLGSVLPELDQYLPTYIFTASHSNFNIKRYLRLINAM